MGQPVVHFEIIGTDPDALRGYYGELFGWEFDTSGPIAESVSRAGDYGFVDTNTRSSAPVPPRPPPPGRAVRGR